MAKSSNSNKGFQFAIITLVSFLLFLVFQLLAANNSISVDIYSNVSSFLIILIITTSILGFTFSIKGLKDPRSFKKAFGIIINSILCVLVVATVVSKLLGF